MNRFRFILILLVFISLSCQNREMRLRTAKTSGLVRELLTKLDSADFYSARKEAEIEEYKKQVESNRDYHEQYDALYKVAENYSHYCIDSSLVYFNRAVQVAADADDELLRIYAQIRLSTPDCCSEVINKPDCRPGLFQPFGVKELSAWAVRAFVGVGTEVVALRLEQVRREVCAAVAVVIF